jgi:hypothetical protein
MNFNGGPGWTNNEESNTEESSNRVGGRASNANDWFNNSLKNQIMEAYIVKSKPIYDKAMWLPASQYDHNALLATLRTKFGELESLIQSHKFSEALTFGDENDLLTADFKSWLEGLLKNASMKGGRRLRRRKSVRRKRAMRRQTRRG